MMEETIFINVIAYAETPNKFADQIATFTNEDLYNVCVPVIEQWINDNYNDGDPNGDVILTESCEWCAIAEIDKQYTNRYDQR